MWMQQSRIYILVVLQEMPFYVQISFVFIVFRSLISEVKLLWFQTWPKCLIVCFYRKFPNQQKTEFCPNVRYDLVAFTWWLRATLQEEGCRHGYTKSSSIPGPPCATKWWVRSYNWRQFGVFIFPVWWSWCSSELSAHQISQDSSTAFMCNHSYFPNSWMLLIFDTQWIPQVMWNWNIIVISVLWGDFSKWYMF